MVRWDVVAVVLAAVGLPFVIFPRLVRRLYDAVARYGSSGAHQRRCERLFWEDIADGPFHECRAVACDHDLAHRPGDRCWEHSFSVAFNTVWNKAQRRHVFVKKPPELALNRDYLAVDVRVLLAYLCIAVDPVEWISWAPDLESFESSDPGDVLILEFSGKTTTAHVESSGFQPYTKRTLNAIFNGAPLCYREKIQMASGEEISFPFSGPDDSRRGGWIIAQGIMDLTDKTYDQMPNLFYFEKHESESNHFMPTFGLAMERVRDILKGPFSEVFPDDKNVKAALAVYESFMEGGRHIWGELDGSDINNKTVVSLDGAHALTAISIFNQPPKFTRAQLEELKRAATPILIPILSAAVHGVWLSKGMANFAVNMGKRLGNLKLNSRIYITGCSSDIETT